MLPFLPDGAPQLTWSLSPPVSDSLQASAEILHHNLQSILEVMSNNRDIFSRVAIHPSTNFPGRTQENILLQILRKKPEPDVENAMDEGRKVFTAMGGNAQVEEALDQKWNAASKFLLERVQRYTDEEDGDLFTAEEYDMGIENVRTGLRKSLVEEDDDDDDEDEDGVSKAKDTEMPDRPPEAAEKPKGLSLAEIARAATKAELPPVPPVPMPAGPIGSVLRH